MALITQLIKRLSLKAGHNVGNADFEHDIPRYPPFARGLPVATAEQLISTQAALLQDIKIAMGLPGHKFDALVRPVIARFAEYVHLLPASEAHHHRGAGGLFRHSLEVAFFALRASEAVVFTRQAHPSAIKALEPRWRMAAFLGGLFHDAGKPISDVTVVTPDGEHEWNTFTDPTIYEWATRLGVERYHLRWTANRHGRHERHTPHALYQLMTDEMKGYMQEAGKEVPEALMDALTGLSVTTPLSKLIIQADSNSVEKDLREQHIGHVDQHAVGVAAERYIVSAMRSLVADGEWQANKAGSLLWVDTDGIYINWRPAAKQITERLAKDKIPGIPQSPDSLAEILLARELAEGQRIVNDDNTVGMLPYWHVNVAGIDMGRGVGKIDFLGLKVPADILYSANTPPPNCDGIRLLSPDEKPSATTTDHGRNEAVDDAPPASEEVSAETASEEVSTETPAPTASTDAEIPNNDAPATTDEETTPDTALSDPAPASDAHAKKSPLAAPRQLTARASTSGTPDITANNDAIIDDETFDDEAIEALVDDVDEVDDFSEIDTDVEVAPATASASAGLFSQFLATSAPPSDDEEEEESHDSDIQEDVDEAPSPTLSEAVSPEKAAPVSPSRTDGDAPADGKAPTSNPLAQRAKPASRSLTSRIGTPAKDATRRPGGTSSPLSVKRDLSRGAAPPTQAPTQNTDRHKGLGKARSLKSALTPDTNNDVAALHDAMLEGLDDGSRKLGDRIDVTEGDNLHVLLSPLADALERSDAETLRLLLKARLIQPGTNAKPRIVLKGKAAKKVLGKLRSTKAYQARTAQQTHHQTPIRAPTQPSSTGAEEKKPLGEDQEQPWWRDERVTQQSGKRVQRDDAPRQESESQEHAPAGVRDEKDALIQLVQQVRAGKGRWITTRVTEHSDCLTVSDIVLSNVREENPTCTATKLKAAIRRQGGELGISRQAKTLSIVKQTIPPSA